LVALIVFEQFQGKTVNGMNGSPLWNRRIDGQWTGVNGERKPVFKEFSTEKTGELATEEWANT
ncbi:MAG: hypothetical protein KDB23_20585, partial [Planctomycetales bacterium]|nr:hypothetical protein [Planctomycetales bacterium]